jgi:DNA-binding transcriptional regulator YhcF (GntR family)
MIIGDYNDSNYGILARLFSSRAVGQILDFFLDHKEFDYSANEIAQKTGLSFRTIFREVPSLEKNQFIYNSRKIGKTNMYRLNTDFQAVLLLERFALEMVQIGNLADQAESTSNENPSNLSLTETESYQVKK